MADGAEFEAVLRRLSEEVREWVEAEVVGEPCTLESFWRYFDDLYDRLNAGDVEARWKHLEYLGVARPKDADDVRFSATVSQDPDDRLRLQVHVTAALKLKPKAIIITFTVKHT